MPARKRTAGEARDVMLRRFAARTLRAHGAALEEIEHGCLRVTPGPLAAQLGRAPIVLAFDRTGLARHEAAHMVATGSPLLGTLIAIARHGGTLTRWRFDPRTPAPARLPTGDAVEPENRRTWVRLYRLHIVAAVHAVEHAQSLVTVVWDPQTHALLDGAELPHGDATFSATRGRSAAPANTGSELRVALEHAQTVIETRLRKTVKRLHASADEQLDRRLAALAAYYRELLAEEGDRKGRARTSGDGERATRLKLEWERKISTERERLAPRGSLRLTAVEELWTPRSLLRVADDPAGRVALWDHAAGVALKVTCRRCTVRHLLVRRVPRGGFVCARCARLEAGAD